VGCERADTVLHGYFDHELDALSAAEFERHMEQCFDCTVALEALKSLRSTLNSAQVYQKTPEALRKKVLADVGVAAKKPVAIAPARPNWQWLAVAATLLLLLYGTWRVVSVPRTGNDQTTLAAEVIDAHLRSLQPGHLTDVVSTDQHTVKPWFDGKLDFAPPVRDFADQGFPLQGGRLDVVNNRTVAALVYGRRKHYVNVFIWPTNTAAANGDHNWSANEVSGDKNAAPVAGSRQGYQWIEWHKNGMDFYAVSDTNSSDLEQLQHLLAQ
jgi:anti-sigma factor RsiW